MRPIRIIPQTYMTADGVKKSYAIILNGVPFREYSENELRIFLKAIGVEYGTNQ